MDQGKTAQLRTVLMFAVTLANCGAKAAKDTSSLARAADFLPLLEEVPGMASLNATELKAEWGGMSTTDREALVASVALDLDMGTAKLTAAADGFLEAGLDMAAAIAKAVAAAKAFMS